MSMDSKNLHYYFAYGMNTNPDAMTERLSADGVARSLGAAHLQEWSFRFAVHADVVPTVNQSVAGVLWQITNEHLARLDAREGYPHYYTRQVLPVVCHGETYHAIVYHMTPGQLDFPPDEGYWTMLEEGYDHFGVSKAQMYRALNDSHQCLLTEYQESVILNKL